MGRRVQNFNRSGTTGEELSDRVTTMMKCRIRALLLTVPVAMAPLIMVAPTAAAEPLNVFNVDTYTERTAAGGEVSFEWVIFNNGTSPILVKSKAVTLFPNAVSVAFQPAFASLEPGASATSIMTVTTDPNMDDANVTVSVTFTATPMDAPEETALIERTANVVDSKLGNVGVNAIFGIWPNPFPPPLDTNWGDERKRGSDSKEGETELASIAERRLKFGPAHLGQELRALEGHMHGPILVHDVDQGARHVLGEPVQDR